MTKYNLYRCFSWKQRNFLQIHNFKYEFKARDLNSNKVFYCYVWSEGLDRCLQEYSKLKINI